MHTPEDRPRPADDADRRATDGPEVTDTNIDLYCLTCGYNLRGLSGDPRRCPECGNMNPIGDLVLPGRLIARQLHNMETAPAICVGAMFASAFVAVVYPVSVLTEGWTSRLEPSDLACPAMAVIGFLTVAGISAVQFRAACLAKPAWARLLVRYQVLGIGMISLFFSLGFVPVACGDWTRRSPPAVWWVIAIIPAHVLLGVILMYFCVKRWYPGLRNEMDTLQREVAVRIARDRLRERLRRT